MFRLQSQLCWRMGSGARRLARLWSRCGGAGGREEGEKGGEDQETNERVHGLGQGGEEETGG